MFVKVVAEDQIIYPYALEQFRAEHRNVSMPAALSSAFLANWNIYPVVAADKPEYDVIYQYVVPVDMPSKVGESWTLGWIIRDKTDVQLQAEFVQKKADLMSSINIARDDAIFQTHIAVLSEDKAVPVDLRKNSPDIQNISGLATAAILKILNGDTTTTSPFKGADDNVYHLTAQETILMCKSVSEHYSDMYQKSWVMKDLLNTLTTIEELNSFVIEF